MGKALKIGDEVSWTSFGGKSVGRIVKKQTSSTRIKSHKVVASPDHPQFIVESETSGIRAAHKPAALRKR